MFIKQLSVILENQKGTLAHWARLLAENDISLIAATISDTGDYGVLRAVVSDPDAALSLLRGQKYAVSVADVLAVLIPDENGSMAKLFRLLAENDVCIEYMYPFNRAVGGVSQGALALRVNLPAKAARVLEAGGVRFVTQAELAPG